MTRKKQRTLPAISTASLPDIIFMLLFFFMVVTVMRKNPPLVAAILPATTYAPPLGAVDKALAIRVGRTDDRLQINDKVIFKEDLPALLRQVTQGKAPTELDDLQIILYADAKAEMGTISWIKTTLRRAGLQRLQYVTQPMSSDS